MLCRRGLGRNAAEVVDEGHFDFIWNIPVPLERGIYLKKICLS